MRKEDIIIKVANETGLTRKDVTVAFDAIVDVMREELHGGEEIDVYRFGKFIPTLTRERIGRNPQTGAPLPVGGKFKVKFKPYATL